MAKLELSEETKAGMEEIKEADLLIAVAVPVEADQLRAAATKQCRAWVSLRPLCSAHRGCISRLSDGARGAGGRT